MNSPSWHWKPSCWPSRQGGTGPGLCPGPGQAQAQAQAQLLEAQLKEAQAQERLAKQLMEARGKAIGACKAKVQGFQQALAQATLPGVGWDQICPRGHCTWMSART